MADNSQIIEGSFSRIDHHEILQTIDSYTLAGLASSQGTTEALRVAELLDSIKTRLENKGVTMADNNFPYGSTVSYNGGGIANTNNPSRFNA